MSGWGAARDCSPFITMISSFENQLESCLPDLWRYACSLTRNRDAADDLVQDCVERALKKRLLWMPGRPLKPWLTKIMLNLFRDHCRREARQPAMTFDFIDDLASTVASPEERLEIKDVWRKLEHIPTEQRHALLAVVVGGLSYDEAAYSLGIPKGTLMSRVSRARAKLKDEMDATAPKIRSIK